jgi:fermentation-respiration switch protein FrsA (DUF1100 family)
LLYVAERSFQYFPERRRTAPSAVGLTNAEDVVLDTADGERANRSALRSRPVGCLVLEAPFIRPSMSARSTTGLCRCGSCKVRAPVLVVHGENDVVVPITLGERLYGLVRAPKRFVRIAGGGHNDLGRYAVVAAKRFIAEQPAA